MNDPDRLPPAESNASGFWAIRGTLFACALLMVWLGCNADWKSGYQVTGQQTDYYNRLVDGFLEGHLSMKADVDPRLLVGDQSAITDGAYLLDASLYRGHYYLYFGAAPAVLVLLPYSFVTGHDLSSNAAVLILVLAGFGFQAAIFLGARRRAFPTLGATATCALLGMLAFGTGTPYLLAAGDFYELAIAGGYFGVSVALWALFRAWGAPGLACRWLALGSFAFGVAVASRPVYLLALPVVLLAAVLQLRARRDAGVPGPARRAVLTALAAAILPAGVVGLALMAYNHGRFDDPFEFGFKYQLNALMSTSLPFAHSAFFWPNLKWYFLTPPQLGVFFPFVFPIDATDRPGNYYGYESITGHWLTALLGVVLLLLVIPAQRSWAPGVRALGRWLILPGLAGLLLFLCLASFGFRADRYTADYLGCVVLTVALLAGIVATTGFRVRGWRIACALLALSAATTAAIDVLGAIQLALHLNSSGPPGVRSIEYAANYFSHGLHRLGLLDYGPVRIRARFDPIAAASDRILLATGISGLSDQVHLLRTADNMARVEIEHEGYGNLRGGPLVALVPNQTHEFEVDLGSLYPPRNHPYFRGWEPSKVELLRSSARIALDGTEILRGQTLFYERTSERVHPGRGPRAGSPPLEGQIVALDRLPERDLRAGGWLNEAGAWRLEVTLPYHLPHLQHPVLGSGRTGAGNMFQLRVNEDKVHLSMDQWGAGAVIGPTVQLAKEQPHVIEIFVGERIVDSGALELPAAQRPELERIRTLLRVWIDGRHVWDAPLQANVDSYDVVSVGSNPQGFSGTTTFYGGTIRRVEFSADELRAFAERNLALPPP